MILDLLSNSNLYRGLPAGLVTALDFLQGTDLTKLPIGKTVIDGERLFALVHEYEPKPAGELKFEAHRRYWDVQFVVSGTERMGWNARSRMTVSEAHDAERDVAFFQGTGSFFDVPAGTFTIFSPSDVHMPGVQQESADARRESIPAVNLVRKVVVKVDVGPPLSGDSWDD
jgi:biofilm protein TabA